MASPLTINPNCCGNNPVAASPNSIVHEEDCSKAPVIIAPKPIYPLPAFLFLQLENLSAINQLAQRQLKEPFALFSKEERKIPYTILLSMADILIDSVPEELKWKGYFELAKAAREQKIVDAAITACRKALFCNPYSEKLWNMTVDIEETRGDQEKAISAMNAALIFCPDSKALQFKAWQMGLT